MAAEEKAKKKAAAPEAGAEKAPKKEKAKSKEKDQPAEAAAEAPKKAPEAPRPPADPRLKVLKKLKGRFLPKGPLRDRHRAILEKWNSGDDHGGVTVEELKGLVQDWKAARAKPTKAGV
jgi:hypothetical protein